jgi:hypothetical protein
MNRIFLICFAIPILIISMFGCAGSPIRTGWEAEKNRSNMLKLKIGMSKEQVLTLMGDPYKTESYRIEGTSLEFWLYLTEGRDIYVRTLGNSNFTPLAFEDNTLTGWGRNYYDNDLRIKQDIKIEKK